MWNRFSRSTCSELEKFREQKLHTKKLLSLRSSVNNKVLKPCTKQAKKESVRSKLLNHEIQKNNEILLKRLIKIDQTSVNKDKIPNKLASTGNLKSFKKIVRKDVGMSKRIKSSKSHYSVAAFERDYKFKQYLRFRISENSRRVPIATDYRSS